MLARHILCRRDLDLSRWMPSGSGYVQPIIDLRPDIAPGDRVPWLCPGSYFQKQVIEGQLFGSRVIRHLGE